MYDPSDQNLPGRSFLYWLLVPVVLAWLATNYLYGAIYDKPQWSREHTATTLQAVKPVSAPIDLNVLPEQGMVTFWFDDAWSSQYVIAEPLLSAKGFKGALAVPTSMIGYEGYANWPQIRTLQRRGWEITNHTAHHDCAMNAWSENKVAEEIQDASAMLWSQGLLVDNFVSPCGVNSEAMKAVIRKQFLTFRGTEDGYNDLKNLDPYNLRVLTIKNDMPLSEVKEWVDYARANNLWLIVVFHQIHTEGEEGVLPEVPDAEKYSISVDGFRAIVDYVDQSGVMVIAPNEALFIRDAIISHTL